MSSWGISLSTTRILIVVVPMAKGVTVDRVASGCGDFAVVALRDGSIHLFNVQSCTFCGVLGRHESRAVGLEFQDSEDVVSVCFCIVYGGWRVNGVGPAPSRFGVGKVIYFRNRHHHQTREEVVSCGEDVPGSPGDD